MVIIETFAVGASGGRRRPPEHQLGKPFMTRHDSLPAQISTLPLRPAQYLAPPDGGIIITITRLLG
jgi:hypothetical protein